jgi:hypothetical protein
VTPIATTIHRPANPQPSHHSRRSRRDRRASTTRACTAVLARVGGFENLEALRPRADIAQADLRAERDDVDDLAGDFARVIPAGRVVREVLDVEGAEVGDVGEALEEGVLPTVLVSERKAGGGTGGGPRLKTYPVLVV